jgi:hypothetical protein
MSARHLGPQQQVSARYGVQQMYFWAADLEKAIAQNDIEMAEKLTAAIGEQLARTQKTLKAAKAR